jgi:hypothetical protein
VCTHTPVADLPRKTFSSMVMNVESPYSYTTKCLNIKEPCQNMFWFQYDISDITLFTPRQISGKNNYIVHLDEKDGGMIKSRKMTWERM